jgi:hypothetical protein
MEKCSIAGRLNKLQNTLANIEVNRKEIIS